MSPRNLSAWFHHRQTTSPAVSRRRRHPLGVERLDGRLLLSVSPSPVAAGMPGGLAEPALIGSLTVGRMTAPDGENTTPIGLTPAQIRSAYSFNPLYQKSLDGTGQTIAIVDPYDDPNLANSTAPNFSTSDLHVFDQEFGLPDPPSFIKAGQSGGTTLPGTDPAGPRNPAGNWEQEEALDVEWAHAIAPGAKILLVETNTPAYSDLYAGVDYARSQPGVSVVSMSWGGGESPVDPIVNATFTTPHGHQGVTFVASTGDNGPPGTYPAYSPNVVAVGGTSLVLNPDNTIQSETAWSDGGVGISGYEPEPAYQKWDLRTGGRTIPDVAFDADPHTGVALCDSYNNGSAAPWEQIGGTSLGAPCWAGLIALANQGRTRAGLPSLDGPSQTLPLLYHLPIAAFHDSLSPVASQVVAGLAQPFTVARHGSVLYQLDSTDTLWQYNSAGWQVIDTGVTFFALGTMGTPWSGGIITLRHGDELLPTPDDLDLCAP